ncbi:PD40 domain-containing protein [bacterium]|nr:PD40 domain-containing protein [bacterium]
MFRLAFQFIILCFFFYCPDRLSAQPESWSHGELNWFTIRTAHFDVHYHDMPMNDYAAITKGPERTAYLVAKIAEEIYGPVTQLYNYKPERVHFIIRDTDDYSNGGAYYYDNKIEIWASSLDFELRGNHNWLRNVITHEFVHMISLQAAMKFSRRIPGFYFQYIGYEKERRQDVLRGFPNIVTSYPIAGVTLPVWFAEGVAQYQMKQLDYEFWDSHRDMILRSRVLSGQLLSLNSMGTFGKNSIGNESAYNSGYAFVTYIASIYGEESLEQICRFSRGVTSSFSGAVKRATGRSLDSIYNDWRTNIEEHYRKETKLIETHLTEGTIFPIEGTANFYPTFSPDGSKFVYISNSGHDYLSQTSLYLYDVSLQTVRKLVNDADGPASWSPDGSKIIYSKNLPDNKYHSHVNDIYIFDIGKNEEFRITRSLRASAPVFSPDGQSIAAVVNADGNNNLILIKGVPSDLLLLSKEFDNSDHLRKGLSYLLLTTNNNGRQIYRPAFHPNGKQLFFDTSIDDGRDIAVLDIETDNIVWILNHNYDERSPSVSPDGQYLYYTSDETGIFNVYRLNLESKEKQLVTNVLGGAFYPSISKNDQLLFTLYKDAGFTISTIDVIRGMDIANAEYSTANPNIHRITDAETQLPRMNQNYPQRWPNKPKSYNDISLPAFDSISSYKTRFLDFSFLPVLRIDYGTFKPGLYFYSSDILSKSSFFGGALFNIPDLDRDLFGIFEFSGFGPTLFLELYNLTRSRTFKENSDPSNDPDPVYESIQKNTFELREVDAGVDFSLLEPRDLRLNYVHAESYVKISDHREFNGVEIVTIPATGFIKYYYGNGISSDWKFNSLKPFVDGEINPRGGRKGNIKYSYNLDNLISGFAFNASAGTYETLYDKAHYHRLDGTYTEYLKMPIKDHTLELSFQGGIIPNKVDSFFNFFGGGLAGLKGYSFYSIEGNKLALLNTTYRFPIWKDIDSKFASLYLDKIFGGIYFGYGDAWSKGIDFKKSIGGELRMEFYSFFVYPTRVTFNAAYGLDKFTTLGPLISKYDASPDGVGLYKERQKILNGKEWRYYLTILFGFTLFD